MNAYSLKILGSGSAKPSINRFQTSMLLSMRDHQFLIDCGEGTQIRMRQFNSRTARLGHIFISHLHGDHFLGLVGMLSTFGMLGRTADITIHSHPDLEQIIGPQLRYISGQMPYTIRFESFNPDRSELIYEDRAVTVTTLPLKHTVPTAGFLFEEKPLPRHINREMCDAWQVPIAYYKELQAGRDFVTPEGETVANAQLTREPTPRRRFAYMSDTAYTERPIELIEGADLLYHEATYLAQDTLKLIGRMHSSALQAATIARKADVKRLIIGHYSSSYDSTEPFLAEARSIFENTEAANDGSTYWF